MTTGVITAAISDGDYLTLARIDQVGTNLETVFQDTDYIRSIVNDIQEEVRSITNGVENIPANYLATQIQKTVETNEQKMNILGDAVIRIEDVGSRKETKIDDLLENVESIIEFDDIVVNDIQTKVTDTQTKVDEIQTNVDTIETNLETARSTIIEDTEDIQTKVTDTQTKVNEIQTNVDTLETKLSALLTSFTTINDKLDSMSTMVFTPSKNINTQIEDMIDLETTDLNKLYQFKREIVEYRVVLNNIINRIELGELTIDESSSTSVPTDYIYSQIEIFIKSSTTEISRDQYNYVKNFIAEVLSIYTKIKNKIDEA